MRLTRVLRPLIGILKVEEMRTFCLHIFGVLRGVTNVMVLTLFLLIIFGVAGVVLVPMTASATQIGFDNIFMAVLNLGVLLTTENFPDIMHDTLDNSVGPNYWWVIYYALFLFIGLLVVNNLVLAVVWDIYKDLFTASALDQRVTERKQLLQAFALLDWEKREYIGSVVWCAFIRELMPDTGEAQSMVMFDTLDLNGDGRMGILEFLKLHQLIALQMDNPLATPQLETGPSWMAGMKRQARHIVAHPWFQTACTCFIAINTVLLMLREKNKTNGDFFEDGHMNLETFSEGMSIVFTVVFFLEISVRYFAGGTRAVAGNWLDTLDTMVVVLSVIGVVLSQLIKADVTWESAEVFMVWRIVRIFQPLMRYPEYRALIETVLATLPAISSLGTMILFEMYSFAILGTELFYKALADDGKTRYENFNSFGQAMLALFQCLVINNWNGLLTELMQSVGKLSCLYFLSFLFWGVMITLTIVSAVFLEVYEFNPLLTLF